MNRKNIISFILIINFLLVFANSNDNEKDTLDYFKRRGFVKTSYMILESETLRPIEKAQVISEICTRLFFYDKETDIDQIRLYKLYKMVEKYRLQITTVDLIEVDSALKRLKGILDNSDSLKHGYKFDNKKGISAYDLEKTLIKNSKDPQDSKKDFHIRKYISDAAWFQNLKGISYFQVNLTLFQPSTDLSYIKDDKLMFSAAFGYYLKENTAFELRRFYYSYYEELGYFGSPVSRYGTRIEPMSFTLKKDYFNGEKHRLYYGYGLTRMKTEHIAEASTREKVEDVYYCMHILWGSDIYSRKKYSLNFEMLYFLNAKGSMNVRGTVYNLKTDKLLVFFGMKFYFSDK